MPGKRKTNWQSIAKKVIKRRKAISSVPKAVYPGRLPYLWTTLTYTDWSYTLNPGAAGTAAVQVFAANGLYDVDITGVGHQPTGFDQLMSLYNEYVVTEAEIECWFENTDTSYAQVVGISFQDLATTTTDSRKYIENGNCVSKVIGNATGATPNISKLTMKANMQQYSHAQSVLTEQDFAGNSTTNPLDTHYFHVFVAPMNQTVDAAQVYLKAMLKFKVLFRDPRLNDLS